MMTYRILHIDDDPDIREIVNLTLGLDPAFEIRSCADGEEALAVAPVFQPDLVLCDVMMPGMDGPTLLPRLRECLASTPVVFVTARAQRQDLEQFKKLGAAGVITKPFDPMTLGGTVRGYLSAKKLAAAECHFSERMRVDAGTLRMFREQFQSDPSSSASFEAIQSCAHKLAGAAGVFGFSAVSGMASDLEEAIVARRTDRIVPEVIEAKLNALIACVEQELLPAPPAADAAQLDRRNNPRQPPNYAGGSNDERS
jgi:CheY-like chemotaxis protein